MKRICLSLVLLFWFASPSGGQNFFKINQYNIVYTGEFMPIITFLGNYQFNKHIAFTSYFYVSAYPKNSWGEGLVGLSYTPVKGITIGFIGGLQSNETELWRVSPIIFLAKKQFSLMGAFEFGGKRFRWDAMGFYTWKSLKFGAEFIRYYQMYAAGPRMEFSFIKSQPITIFYSALWDWSYGHYASMFGIYSTFGILGRRPAAVPVPE